MLHIYVTCGSRKSGTDKKWVFVADGEKRARLVAVESNTTLAELETMVLEDYGVVDHKAEFSYLPSDLIDTVGSPPVSIANDRQLKNFVGYSRNKTSVNLCVTFTAYAEHPEIPINIELMMKASDSSCIKNDQVVKSDDDDIRGIGHKVEEEFDEPVMVEKKVDGEQNVRLNLLDVVKKDQIFRSKTELKAFLEISAMKYNFDYNVLESTKHVWCIRCKEKSCNWRIRAQCLEGSEYFRINKYVAQHTCAPSNKDVVGRTASAKTIGNLIKNKFEGANAGPSPREIIHFIRTEHGCDISYDHAWEAREYAISIVRGIPGKSYAKIPKYLHMLKEANPGIHTQYETDITGRFKFLFLSFGQSVRGFYKAIRRVIVVDGTFLKNKYKRVLLVATALDGNSNLYPIAFGVVDSENDLSWEWFMRQLKVVIADKVRLAFVSDRNVSVIKALEKVYPQSSHGIWIHHLLNNVITFFKTQGLTGLIAKASKEYRVSAFDTKFAAICSISPAVGKYLQDAGVEKWARCKFPGFSSKHQAPLTVEVETKIERRIDKGKPFIVYPVSQDRFLVKGDKYDCLVDLDRRTCSCGKYDLLKIPCRHAIKAAFSVNQQIHILTDHYYTTEAWRTAYEECINPIAGPEDDWCVPDHVEHAKVVEPESRRAAGRRKKRRYESVEDKIRASQGSQRSKKHKCSRCGIEGHKRGTCDMPI
ncbi:uncharacterized protein LOC112085995 [Eutrema salsugineum]|uniref:uncharacterized protein LOC112085995 n=1 Tax=Eutrema salsugineum TaxID=72664 RepID=UPI000CECEAA1|nr:uncharacterized protein LOC112085995 [Eutrema salsugineum]